MIRNPNVNINAIGLSGSKGLGKSAIASSIAEALNRPFKMISLGGESDSASLTGHGYTYIGSTPGRLIDILINSKTMNPVILIDEIDKISDTHHGQEIIGTLIHMTDHTTNSKYNNDKYFAGIDFDISKVLFIFTYNEPKKIDPILADRLYKINVDNYTFKEKMVITNKHLINNVLEKMSFNINDIKFSDSAVEYLVKLNENESGMRTIKQNIEIIISRINNLLLTNKEDDIIKLKYKKMYNHYQNLPIVIEKDHIDTLLEESTSIPKNTVPLHMYI
jgi:ATP-dependent Lon protease